ncbi:hypothetical protein [Streptomyces sp. KS 21]|uniref:hypothetical protein n=1 Tax=Streptomyces sp. KS 21 TaxID=2485150 RepID=UPI001063F5B5|nr:hypothetical protein [Streptomyces sp. KS 21]TDU80300.1 hypothetical protein EDD91_7136 [Streptomyces sp. KS 21]
MGTATRLPPHSEVEAAGAESHGEGEGLSGEEAWAALPRHGGWNLVRDVGAGVAGPVTEDPGV